MSRHIPLPAPSQRTLDAMAATAARTATYQARNPSAPRPEARQVWVEDATGTQVRLLDRNSSSWVGLVLGSRNSAEPEYRSIGLDEHASSWSYVRTDCEHETYCCTEHGTHASPHQGCVLR